MVDLGIDTRSRRRWLEQAVEIGLIHEHKEYYYITGLARAALILGCNYLGNAATVEVEALVRKGWRAYLWSAYLVTLNNRLVSQEKKAELTGVRTRTQRNYQASVPGTARQNYVDRGQAIAGKSKYMNEECGIHTFENRRRVVQRLPDIRTVPLDVSKQAKRGRSRKAQKKVNSSLLNERGSRPIKLFCETRHSLKRALKAVEKMYVADRPDEIFEHVRAGPRANSWRVVCV